MTKIVYIQPDGAQNEVDVPDGWTIMEGAVKNDVPGIDGDCGGGCACATCHVYVAELDQSRLSPKSEMEETMLDFAPNLTPESRLSCQIEVKPALDGLTVRLPKTQRF